MKKLLPFILAPWIIICDDRGRYNFTDEEGRPMTIISLTREDAEKRRAALQNWIAAGRPQDLYGEIEWHPCGRKK